MLNRLLRLAAFQNPEFYKAQAMRLSTYDKPRVIACGTEFQLKRRFGSIPNRAEERLGKLTTRELEGLSLRLFDATSLEDLLQ